MRTLLSVLLMVGATSAQAVTIYQADFSQAVSIDHTNTGNTIEASTQAGANFEIGYSGSIASDSTRNFFETDGDSLISSDFGGEHFMRSDAIDISAWDSVDLLVEADLIGSDVFNNTDDEFLSYFYEIDSGPQVSFFTANGTPNPSSIDDSLTNLFVGGASSLVVGLVANVNGAGDGFDLTSYSVVGNIPTAAPVPLPAGLPLLLTGFAALCVARTRRRKS